MFYMVKIASDGNNLKQNGKNPLLPVLQLHVQHTICLLNFSKHTIMQYRYIRHAACNFNLNLIFPTV